MPTDQDIQDQWEELHLHRDNLRTALRKVILQGGEAFAQPGIRHQITEARVRIADIKIVLRRWGVEVEDHPNDTPPAKDLPPIIRRTSEDESEQLATTSKTLPPHQQLQQRQAEVLLITVTEGETKAVFKAFHDQTNQHHETHYQGDKTYYNLGVLGGARVWLVGSEMGAVTPGGAFATVFTAITAIRPAAILMVGIAFGVDATKQHIGDVLIARQLQSYEPQRVSTVDGALRLIPRGDKATASVRALDRCRDAALSWEVARVKFGVMLSGDKLLDHKAAVQALLAQEPEAIGGEMEGAGLYVAATQHRIDWLLIKAICDWADGNKAQDKEERQALAARHAAQFVVHLLAKGGFAPKVWGS